MEMAKRSKQAIKTIAKQVKLTSPKRRLSSEAFLKKADKLWREGPLVKYKDPDAW
jgi:hypothetical protein